MRPAAAADGRRRVDADGRRVDADGRRARALYDQNAGGNVLNNILSVMGGQIFILSPGVFCHKD